MCRLLGIRANRPVDLDFSLRSGEKPFKGMARCNPDGWGMGWYHEGVPRVYKEGDSALKSGEFDTRSKETSSNIFICHVRNATKGRPSRENSHPFAFEKWLFAHNGSICNPEGLRRRLCQRHDAAIEGETDSEVYFHWLLQNIENKDGDVRTGITASVAGLEGFTALNLILSDGDRLYAYRNAARNQDYYSLLYLERDPQVAAPETLRSRDVDSLIRSKGLRGEKSVLICSECLTTERWCEIPLGSVLDVSGDLVPHLESLS